MLKLENPFPSIATATDAASKIVALKADLFLLNQELKTIRHIKRIVLAGCGLIFLNLLLTLSFYWISVSLYEQGWSALSLAGLSFAFFGAIIAAIIFAANRIGKEKHETRPSHQ